MKFLLLLFQGAKLGKVALMGGSMLLSVVAYAFVFGWGYAVGFVFLILIHEMGHFVAARQRGLQVGLPTFIPFVGAWVELKDMPHDAETEAYIGIAGPVAGSLAALACFEFSKVSGDNLYLALAYSGFMLNLFNLIPLSPFDGGRVTQVVSPKLWLVGAPLLVALFIWHPSPIFLLMALLAYPAIIRAWRGEAPNPAYYNVPLTTRVNYGALYLGLIAYLGAMSYSIHETLSGKSI